MDNQTNTSFLELLLNIGTSFDLKTCVNDALLSYIQQLDCIGSILFENVEKDSYKPLFYKPKILEKDDEIKKIFDNFFTKFLKNRENFFINDLPYIIKIENTFYYIYQLGKFGYLLLIKKSEEISQYNLKELRLINKKFSKSLEACKDKNLITQKDEMLFHQSRMATMGELMQNITHQWKQPLSTISIIASGTKVSLEYGDEIDKEALYKSIDDIISKVNYLSETINEFKSYYDGNRKKSKFLAKDLIDTSYDFLSSRLKLNSIDFIVNHKEEIAINSYKNELGQIIMNILNNAIDELERINIEKKVIIISTFKNRDNILISIKDNANGIPKKIFENIFNPYFTTKNKGTGIGLYMVRQLIKKHLNGTITAQNTQYELDGKTYKGAEFIVEFPIDTPL